MAQALGLLLLGSASSVSIAGIALTTAAGGLTIAGSIFNIGASLLLSAATQALFAPDLPAVGPDSIKVNTASEMMPRVKHYGEVRVGYAIIFTSAKSGKLYRLIVHGHGQIGGISQYYVDKSAVTVGTNGFVEEEQYAENLLKIESRLGVIPEAPYQDLIDDFPEWSAQHRLDGLSTTLITATLPGLDRFNAVYPNREPTLEAVLNGSIVTDPRTGDRSYSDNLAVCAYDYEIDPDGANLGDLVDVDSFAAAADACDEVITVVNQSPERSWRTAQSFDLNEDPAEVRGRFIAACGGEYYLTPAGKLGLRVGGWEEPEFTLTEAMLSDEGFEAEFGLDAVSGYSISTFQYVEPTHGHIRITGDQYEDADRIEAIGRQKDNPFFATPSHRQCRHAAKIKMEQENPEVVLRVKCKPVALEMFYERFVTVDFPTRRITGTFQIKSKAIDPQTLAQTYTLHLVTRKNVELDPSEFGTVPPYGGEIESSTTPEPTGFTAIQSGVPGNAGIAYGFDPAPYPGLTPRIEIAQLISEPGETLSALDSFNWSPLPSVTEFQNGFIAGLNDGETYFLRMAWQTSGGAVGPYTEAFEVIAGESNPIPLEPSGFTVATVPGSVTAELNFTVATGGGVHVTQVRRDGDLIARLRDNAGEAVQFFDTPLDGTGDPQPGTYTYSLTTVSVAYERSAEVTATPITLT